MNKSDAQHNDVTLIGGFPPPINGAAKNNQLLYEKLDSLGFSVRRLNIAGPTLSHRRSAAYHLGRIRRILASLLSISMRGGRLVYIVPDGGYGIWYSFSILLLSRVRFRRQIIHHRTFRYINRRSFAMTSIVTATRSTATHVFLTEGMRRQFETLYGKTHSLICTNAVYVEDDIDTPIPMTEMAPRLRLGHLSNLCRAKGYYDVVDTFEGLLSVGVDCELHLAGPVVEPQVSNGIETLRRRHGNRVSYEGAVYGASKASFYQGIDVFLFPTDYPEEAAPNVLYEALAHGVPVIAKRRGCIEDIVANVNVGSVFDAKIFVTSAIETIRRLKVDPDSRIARSRTIREHITQEVALSTAQHRHLLQLIAESQW